jgi:hypothetical protein
MCLETCLLHDGGNCDFIDPERCPDECDYYQDLKAERDELKTENERLKLRVIALEALLRIFCTERDFNYTGVKR